jgi:hypothetical protein
VQRVAEFVKRGSHFILSEQCRFARGRLRNIEMIRNHWLSPQQIVLRDISIHPRAAALRRSGVIIAYENRQRFTIAIEHLPDAHVWLVHRQVVPLLECEPVFLVCSEKDAVDDDMIQFVIRAHLRFIEVVFRLAHFLGIQIPIACRDLEAAFLMIDDLLLLGRFTLRVRDRRGREIGQKFVHDRHVVRRLVFELVRRPIIVAQQLRFLRAKPGRLQHDIARIELATFAVSRE